MPLQHPANRRSLRDGVDGVGPLRPLLVGAICGVWNYAELLESQPSYLAVRGGFGVDVFFVTLCIILGSRSMSL